MPTETEFRMRAAHWLYDVLDTDTIHDLESELEELDLPCSAADVAIGIMRGWIIIGRK